MSNVGLPDPSGVGAPSPDGKGLGPLSPTGPATPNPIGQSPRAAVPVSNARAKASRRNGARSKRPKSPEGKARAAQNALKHGLRALKYVMLPDERAAEFHALQEALMDELAPVGTLHEPPASPIPNECMVRPGSAR
jgi:hypothetical protein